MNRSFVFPLKIYIYFFIRIYFHGHWRLTWQQWKGWDDCLFHSTTSTCSLTSIYLFVTISCETIFVISHICNCTTCIYQPAPRSDLQPYRMTIFLIDDVKLVFVCLCDDLILAFLLQQLEKRNQWIWPHMDYHSCITSEPTNQMCCFPGNRKPLIYLYSLKLQLNFWDDLVLVFLNIYSPTRDRKIFRKETDISII